MLLALISAGRTSDIYSLPQHKVSNKTLLRLPSHIFHHIDLYLDKMKEFHKIEAQLLLSFIKPHKGVTT